MTTTSRKFGQEKEHYTTSKLEVTIEFIKSIPYMMVVKRWDTTFILYRAALKIIEFLSEKVKNLDPNLFLPPSAIIPTTMSILTVNVRSLKKHLNDLEALVHSLESPPNVICLTETWLTDNDDIDSLLVPGYKNYAIKNRNTHGGGVMI